MSVSTRANSTFLISMLVCTLAGPTAAMAQTPDAVVLADSVSRLIHQAVITGETETLETARRLAERGLTVYPEHPLLEHHRAAADFRAASRLAESDMDAAQTLLDRAQDVVDDAVDREGAIAETHALRGSIMGMRITGMLRGITLGPRADRALDRAVEMDPTNPRIWLAKGISTLHKPGFTGGGADRAIEALERGIGFLRADHPARGHPIGGGAELWAWLGVAHLQSDRPDEAVAALERALELEPEFGWVRDTLLPAARGN